MFSSKTVLLAVLCTLSSLIPISELQAQECLQPKEALALAYPKAEISRASLTLTKKQRKSIEAAAGKKLASARVRPYRAMRDGKCVGTAYFDTRKVRSKAQTLMIAISPEGLVQRIEVLRFDEPREYRAPAKWLAQLPGKGLSDALKIKGEVRNLTGATLTAHATLHAVREALAIHAELYPKPEPKPEPTPQPDPQPTPKPKPKPI
jgi:Na+-translocating ferredoxin:NAD+ oxidoreductase RnfG subunit